MSVNCVRPMAITRTSCDGDGAVSVLQPNGDASTSRTSLSHFSASVEQVEGVIAYTQDTMASSIWSSCVSLSKSLEFSVRSVKWNTLKLCFRALL